MWSPTQNLGSIGSAVSMFIGYRMTDRQTSKSIYILECVSDYFQGIRTVSV